MSRWTDIIIEYRKANNLGAWDIPSEEAYTELAALCSHAEIEDIRQRLAELEKDEADIPDWDGDALDDLRRARQLFEGVLKMAGEL